MRPSDALRDHRETIRRIVQENRAVNPRVFGSVLRGSDDEDSDLDLLVDPTNDTSLLDIARIQNCLQTILGIRVDVVTPTALPEKFREKVLHEATPL